jgi:hypothetical protein
MYLSNSRRSLSRRRSLLRQHSRRRRSPLIKNSQLKAGGLKDFFFGKKKIHKTRDELMQQFYKHINERENAREKFDEENRCEGIDDLISLEEIPKKFSIKITQAYDLTRPTLKRTDCFDIRYYIDNMFIQLERLGMKNRPSLYYNPYIGGPENPKSQFNEQNQNLLIDRAIHIIQQYGKLIQLNVTAFDPHPHYNTVRTVDITTKNVFGIFDYNSMHKFENLKIKEFMFELLKDEQQRAGILHYIETFVRAYFIRKQLDYDQHQDIILSKQLLFELLDGKSGPPKDYGHLWDGWGHLKQEINYKGYEFTITIRFLDSLADFSMLFPRQKMMPEEEVWENLEGHLGIL